MPLPSPAAADRPTALVVGGGLAGLAAAEGLAARGFAVTILEARPRLGGRAASFIDHATDTLIDNCQHVAMGCCTNFLAFCERTGVAGDFAVEDELTWIDGRGRATRFAATAGPAPLHLAAAFAGMSFLPLADRARLPLVLRALARAGANGAAEEPFDRWLAGRQSPAAIERFWKPVLVSALSESLDRIATRYARQVLVEGFVRHRDAWRVHVPTKPFDAIYRDGVVPHLESLGCVVREGAGVAKVEIDGDGRVAGVVLRDGTSLIASHVVLAVPSRVVGGLLPDSVAGEAIEEAFEWGQRLEHAPISSVHLVYDRALTPLRHAVLLDRTSQWVFNHTAISGAHGLQKPCRVSDEGGDGMNGSEGNAPPPLTRQGYEEGDAHAYQVVISASREERAGGSAALIDEVAGELKAVWPVGAKRLAGRVVTEHRAVFSPLPGVDAVRPSARTPFPGLTLAGDWTATGWPATMEGAVRSGYLAAEDVLGIDPGDPPSDRVLVPDLPASPLSRWLFP